MECHRIKQHLIGKSKNAPDAWKFPDDEATFAQLEARIAITIAWLQAWTRPAPVRAPAEPMSNAALDALAVEPFALPSFRFLR